jgi:hypothetical protein
MDCLEGLKYSTVIFGVRRLDGADGEQVSLTLWLVAVPDTDDGVSLVEGTVGVRGMWYPCGDLLGVKEKRDVWRGVISRGDFRGSEQLRIAIWFR